MSAGDYYAGTNQVNSTNGIFPAMIAVWCNIHGQFFVQFRAPIVCPTCQMQQYAQQVQQQTIPVQQYVVPWIMTEPLTIPPGEIVAAVDAARHHRSCGLRKGGGECTC